MDFFDSGGLSCRLLYRTSGLDGSIHLLLQLIREIFPIIRLNIVSGSSDLRVFVPIVDTLPNGLTRVREAGKGRKSYPIIAHGSDLSKPLLLNDLESFKREALKIDPSVTELPFYSHAALLRLPLFARGSFTFLINFWSNEKNSFKEEDIEPLSRLIAPLAEELAAAFTDIPIAVGGSGTAHGLRADTAVRGAGRFAAGYRESRPHTDHRTRDRGNRLRQRACCGGHP